MKTAYHLVYYNFYCLARFIRKNAYSDHSGDYSLESVLLLSIMMFLNVITIGIWLQVPYITTGYNMDLTLLGISIFGANALYFLRKKRYEIIVEEYDKSTSPKLFDYQMITIAYSALTCFLFYWMHS